MVESQKTTLINTEQYAQDILTSIDREREREIIARRFGLFDRPWFPERNVHGNLRYMSSDSTKKKFKMAEYLEYVDNLDSPTLL